MTPTPILSKDVIKAQARRAAEADHKAGDVRPSCPYEHGTESAKRWLAAYWTRELELMEAA